MNGFCFRALMLGLTHHWKIGLNYDEDERMSHWGVIHLKESCVPLTLYSWCVYVVSLRLIHCYAKLNPKQKIDLRLGNERSPVSLCATQTQFLFLPLCHASWPLELDNKMGHPFKSAICHSCLQTRCRRDAACFGMMGICI